MPKNYKPPAGSGVFAWLYMMEGYLAANVRAPEPEKPPSHSILGRLMINTAIEILTEDPTRWPRLIGEGRNEHESYTLSKIDLGINMQVAHNLLEWNDPAEISALTRGIFSLRSPKFIADLPSLAAAFGRFPGHTPYSSLLGALDIIRSRMIQDARFGSTRDLHTRWVIDTYWIWEELKAQHEFYTSRDVVLEIHLDEPKLVVRLKPKVDVENLDGTPNIVVIDQRRRSEGHK